MEIIEAIISILIFCIFSLFFRTTRQKGTLRIKRKYRGKRYFRNKLNKLESGYLGELKVSNLLSSLSNNDYIVINDIMIELDNMTVQIDHIVVSVYGIFVIETKNYNGWIYGSSNGQYWTKNIFGYKYSFYNPILQNRSHITVLSKKLKLPYNNFISVVVFLDDATIMVDTNENVINSCNLINLINSYGEAKLYSNDLQKIATEINLLDITSNDLRKQHANNVKNLVKSKEIHLAEGICPRCGHKLVVKEGKYGAFLGCTNFPECKFIQSLKYFTDCD